MNNVHFIVNPVAGKGDLAFDEEDIASYFDRQEYEITVKISNCRGHATELARESIVSGANIIVACGGDGTINEVASCLVHTDVLLGIIAMGSGNGFAESLKIPRNIVKAVEIIKSGKISKIDVAWVNGRAFFSNMGIGFDARVISNYNSSRQRRLLAYLKAIIKSIRDFKYHEMIMVEMDGKRFRTTPFMFFVSNSKVMGYEFSLTRFASLQDGLLDVVVIDNLNKGEMVLLGLLILLRLNHNLKKIRYFKVRELKLVFEDKFPGHLMQADGELYNISDREVLVNLEAKALNVLIPQN